MSQMTLIDDIYRAHYSIRPDEPIPSDTYVRGVVIQDHILVHRNKVDIQDLYNGYSDVSTISTVTKIGVDSTNATVSVADYVYGFITDKVLIKTSRPPTKNRGIMLHMDNLYYEYQVGIRVNYMTKYVPNLVRTLGLFKKDMNAPYTEIKMIRTQTDMTKDSCIAPTTYGIMIEYIPSIYTLHEYMYSLGNKYTMYMPDIVSILWQIYACLTVFNKYFTHNDLHLANVMLYRVADGYIDIRYHTATAGTITIKSRYIPIIIDYGRAYMGPIDTYGSTSDIIDKVCKLDSYHSGPCALRCGDYKGYPTMAKLDNKADVQLLKDIGKALPTTLPNIPYIAALGKLFTDANSTTYTCGEISGRLLHIILDQSYIDGMNALYGTDKVYGKMDIYTSVATPYTFTRY